MRELEQLDNLLHGGDYNVEQWLNRPDILKEDIRLMKEAKVNVVTLGVFSWAALEPREGVYTFEWLDNVMDSMYEAGIYVILATPSGGKPPWMGKKYPAIMRTKADRVRLLYGERENHCNSNVIYREKVKKIDNELGKRYANHKALLMWHISNEMYGTCHCDDCQKNFRLWLKKKYGSIDKLNQEYWTTFWSHTYTDFDEIESPAAHGETAIHGLMIDYKRFYSDLSIEFLKMELDTVRKYNEAIPITSNMFHHDCGINYYDLNKILDVISWDSYPRWHCSENKKSEWSAAIQASFDFDFCRSLKHKPFYLMESTPSTSNGFAVTKLKKPKLHELSGVQVIASGSDSVQYFQWRKSRGSYEKFHGAVVSHNGSSDTRVFREVSRLGERLSGLNELKGSNTYAEVALIYDWENLRALDEQKNLKKNKKNFSDIIKEHYEALVKNYVSVDIIDQNYNFDQYKLVVMSSLYMLKEETINKLKVYVENGGTVVMTYYSGLVNENDLCYLGWAPYGLNEVFGVRAEEIDSLLDSEFNLVKYGGKEYKAYDYCEVIKVDTASVIGNYASDYYDTDSAITKNQYGTGTGYYVAFHGESEFLYDFYSQVIQEAKIERIIESVHVEDIIVKVRENEEYRYIFALNFASESRTITILDIDYVIDSYEYKIIKQKKGFNIGIAL